jgi:hypothetical protein
LWTGQLNKILLDCSIVTFLLYIANRNLAFVGGVDLAYQRWDDEKHRVVDEEGTIYPGKDYRQPAPSLFKPVRNIIINSQNTENFEDEDCEAVIEPETATLAEDGDNEKVVDLGTFVPLSSSNLKKRKKPNLVTINEESDQRNHDDLEIEVDSPEELTVIIN